MLISRWNTLDKMTLSPNSENISQHDTLPFIHDQGFPANIIYQHLVDVLGEVALAYSTVTRTLRQLSWTAPDMPKGTPPKFLVDAGTVCVLNRDPTAPLPGIAEEVNPPVSTLFLSLKDSNAVQLSKMSALTVQVVCPAQKRSSEANSRVFRHVAKCKDAPVEIHSDRRRVLFWLLTGVKIVAPS